MAELVQDQVEVLGEVERLVEGRKAVIAVERPVFPGPELGAAVARDPLGLGHEAEAEVGIFARVGCHEVDIEKGLDMGERAEHGGFFGRRPAAPAGPSGDVVLGNAGLESVGDGESRIVAAVDRLRRVEKFHLQRLDDVAYARHIGLPGPPTGYVAWGGCGNVAKPWRFRVCDDLPRKPAQPRRFSQIRNLHRACQKNFANTPEIALVRAPGPLEDGEIAPGARGDRDRQRHRRRRRDLPAGGEDPGPVQDAAPGLRRTGGGPPDERHSAGA